MIQNASYRLISGGKDKMKAHYDYLIVGAGLFGAVFAHKMTEMGRSCLIIDKRDHIAGNVYTRAMEGIQVHMYGAHIFHTSDSGVWDYVNSFAEFNRYVNSPLAVWKEELYNLPFNMNTFSRMWKIRTPEEARKIISDQIKVANISSPRNLEEQAISLVGIDIYEKLIKGYTEKQWGKDCRELPPSIIKRLPVRFVYDNNYFADKYQGIPIGGYTRIVEQMLHDCDVLLSTDYFDFVNKTSSTFGRVVYTGPIDRFYDYSFGELEYRGLRFEMEVLDMDNYQGNAVVNYTESSIPYTRIIEHKHFEFGQQPKTVITREYPLVWSREEEPYYTINDERNTSLYMKYKERALQEKNVIFGGRLGSYQYYDMDKVIRASLDCAELESKR